MIGILRSSGFAALSALLMATVAAADTTIERPGSILIFPKVVFDEDRDTIIQITNTSNSVAHAHCYYINAVPECEGIGDCLAGTCAGRCLPRWIEINFDIALTKQQPTSWSAGFGRIVEPFSPICNENLRDPALDNYDCYGAGIDPGRIPPTSLPFVGELRCIEVDVSGAPIGANRLKGEATIVSTDGEASKYSAIAVLGLEHNDGDNTLCLGGTVTDECPIGAEYNACPDALVFNHFAEQADSPLIGNDSRVNTEITVIPCAQNLERLASSRVTVHFSITNEFEETFSASTVIDCWANFFLNDVNLIFDVSRLGTRVVQTRMRPANDSQSGILAVSEEYHCAAPAAGPGRCPEGVEARAAYNLHQQGHRSQADLIVIPEGL